jgi:iron(III) transport system ATP-binding protein
MLKVTGLSKAFTTDEGAFQAVDDVSFEVAQGQCFALLGPSGCGKTTALRCIAGLEQPEHGAIEIGSRLVSDTGRNAFVPVHERSIGMVFQSYAIWPHLDVFENVAYPLRVQPRPRAGREEIERRVMDVLALVGMTAMARRPAPRLSGGQQQRVALARAIVRRPSLLLLDEPLSNLDARLRETMRRELSALVRQIGITALFVTHDQVEALSIADRVAVMNEGRIVQEGTPADVYDRPRSNFVARFLGAGNILSGSIEQRQGAGKALIVLDGGGHRLLLGTDCAPGEPVDIVLRPESLALSTDAPTEAMNSIPGRVTSLSFQGGYVEYEVLVDGGARLRVHARAPATAEPDRAVCIQVDPARGLVFKRAADAFLGRAGR